LAAALEVARPLSRCGLDTTGVDRASELALGDLIGVNE
jgi:hypothetical protein